MLPQRGARLKAAIIGAPAPTHGHGGFSGRMAAHTVGGICLYPPAGRVDARNLGRLMAVVARISLFCASVRMTGCAGDYNLTAVIERKRMHKGAALPRLGGVAGDTIAAVRAQVLVYHAIV
jgi:hypothetical protein